MTATQKAYREFLKTPFWLELTARKKARVGHCERCPSVETLQSHHRFYRADWFETQLEDLEVLCRACHRAEHGIRVREWWYSEDADIEAFYHACSAFIRAAWRTSSPIEDDELAALEEFAAIYPEHLPIQYQIGNVRKARQWQEEQLTATP